MSNKSTYTLYIDTAEKVTGFEVCEYFRSIGWEVIVEQLPVGDYAIPSHGILVERKESNDLHGSVNGRLKSQLLDMQQAQYPFLVTHGNLTRAFSRNKMANRTLPGLLLSFALGYENVRHVHVDNIEQFMVILEFLPRWVENNQNLEAVTYERHKFTLDRHNPHQRLFAIIPGMGPVKIEKFMKLYPNFFDFREAYYNNEIGHNIKGKSLPKITEQFLDSLR